MRRRQPQQIGEAYLEPPKVVFIVFLGFLVFWYLQVGNRIPALGRLRIELIVGSFLTVCALVLQMTRPAVHDGGLGESQVVRWGAALLVMMAVMVPLSVVPQVSWNIFANRPLKMAMIGIMIGAFVTSPGSLAWVLGAYLVAFLKMAQEGVTGYLTGSLVWENQGIPRLHGSTDMYRHPNSLSGTQLGTIPFLAGLIAVAPFWLRIVMIGQMIAAVATIVFCGSRTADVALLGWLAYRVAASQRKLKALIVVVIVASATIAVIPDAYVERFDTIFTQKDKEGGSIEARKEILRDAWVVFKGHPFGVGVGAFPAIRERMFGRHQDTHNLYFEIATNLGIPGAAVFCGFVVSMFRTLRRVLARAKLLKQRLQSDEVGDAADAEKRKKLVADLELVRQTCMAVMGFLVVRLFLGFFGMDLYEVYWWFAAGLTFATARIVVRAEIATSARQSKSSEHLTA